MVRTLRWPSINIEGVVFFTDEMDFSKNHYRLSRTFGFTIFASNSAQKREQNMFSVDPVIFVIFLAVVLAFMSLRIVKEYDRGVIFFLGKVTGVRGPGLIILIPVLEQTNHLPTAGNAAALLNLDQLTGTGSRLNPQKYGAATSNRQDTLTRTQGRMTGLDAPTVKRQAELEGWGMGP